MGLRGLGQFESAIDYNLELAFRDFFDESLQMGQSVDSILQKLGALIVTDEGFVLACHECKVWAMAVPANTAHGDNATAVGGALQALFEIQSAHRVDDEIGSLAVGQFFCGFDKIHLGIIDAMIESEIFESLQSILR